MATTKFYLDVRSVKTNGTSPLKIVLTRNGKSAYHSIGVFLTPNQWDKTKARILNHPNKQKLNTYIQRRRIDLDTFIMGLKESGEIYSMTARNIKDKFESFLSPEDEDKLSLEKRFLAFIDGKENSTKELYQFTFKKIQEYCASKRKSFSSLRYEDITKEWLTDFEKFLSKRKEPKKHNTYYNKEKKQNSKNYINIHLRNLRAVFNSALDAEDTTYYPFRKFKIKAEETRKRAMTLESLRELFNCEVEPYAEIYRDMFKLIFMMIGINIVDLHRLKEITPQGRVEFFRAKTKRKYSIKVEPEALEIIQRYSGTTGLLCIADRWKDHRNLRHQLNNALQQIGCSRKGRGGAKQDDSPFKGITSYWARHSWATIARKIGVSKDDIKLALGHGAKTVSDIYIDEDLEKIDIANRKVLDYVLYDKIST